MRYKCLVLDHDDTVVKSTECIHYPCFISFMQMQGRDMRDEIPIEKYLERNCLGNIMEFYLNDVGLSQELLDGETRYWRECVNNCVPIVYDGLREILTRFCDMGGKIFVASHSESRFILRDYKENGLPTPDGVYGYDAPDGMRKPSPRIIEDIIKATGFDKDEILVVDDLKHGYDMARAAGVAFAAAGWAHSVPAIESFMKSNCDFYFSSVKALSDFLLQF